MSGDALHWHSSLDHRTRSNWEDLEAALLKRFRRTFSGGDGTECDAFVRMVRQRAIDQGKESDSQWIARFASFSLEGEALRWYSSLNDTVQDDWRLLQRAIFDKYPVAPRSSRATDTLRGSSIPTPAAAPESGRIRGPLGANTAPNTSGVIRIVDASSNQMFGYISQTLESSGWFIATQDYRDAMHFLIFKNGELNTLKLLSDHPDYVWLGLTWNTKRSPAPLYQKHTTFASLTAVASEGVGASDMIHKGQSMVAQWRLYPGSLVPCIGPPNWGVTENTVLFNTRSNLPWITEPTFDFNRVKHETNEIV
ncbi:hypothetical protein FRB99_008454, partial [Tulasnella sp. 403]